jgi:hypothetical protein
MYIVSKWEREHKRNSVRTLIAKPTFKSLKIIDEDLVIIEMKRMRVLWNKPSYIGIVTLEIAKFLNYKFFYEFLLETFGDSLKLLYVDTGKQLKAKNLHQMMKSPLFPADSFIIKVNTDDIYEDMRPHLSQWVDTSNYSPEMLQQLKYPLVNKSVIGKVKDETNGHAFVLFAALQSKVYCKQMETFNEIVDECKAKGLDKYKIRELSAENYLNVLNTREPLITHIRRIETKIASIKTVTVRKIAIAFGDEKRFQIPNSFDTLAHGNHKIQQYTLDDDDTEKEIIK